MAASIFNGPSFAHTAAGMVCVYSISKRNTGNGPVCSRGALLSATFLLPAALLLLAAVLPTGVWGQQADENWQVQVREYAATQNWVDALRVVDQQIVRSPNDMDIRAWRARVLTWAGRLVEAEHEYDQVLKVERNDPDNWMGLAGVYLREGRLEEALKTADHAVELDPKRADLRTARGRILRAGGDMSDARLEFRRALALDPGSAEAQSGLFSLRDAGKHELRFGFDGNLLSFAPAYYDQWTSLVSKWTPQWTTSVAGNFFQRGGTDAGSLLASVTGSRPRWGALTLGGASAHDNGVIPETEAFFELDHGFQLSEDRPVRAIEVIYGQHWYWYATARILTASETAVVYLPRNWTWSIGLTEARSHFSGTTIDWRPSGLTRIAFPLGHWPQRELSGNAFFAVGTEDFAQVDQIGSFASRTYGGGLRFRFSARQDISTYAAFQQRTQDRAQTSYGLSYGIRF